MNTEQYIIKKVNEIAENDFASNYDEKMNLLDCISYLVAEQIDIDSSKVYDLLLNLINNENGK
tara:strand:+ start:59 stop:247 length:189 start_codon:yes stop_codon:yes gene_type:complete